MNTWKSLVLINICCIGAIDSGVLQKKLEHTVITSTNESAMKYLYYI